MKIPRKGPTNDDALRWIDKMFPAKCPTFQNPLNTRMVVCAQCKEVFNTQDGANAPANHPTDCLWRQARELLAGKGPSEEGALALLRRIDENIREHPSSPNPDCAPLYEIATEDVRAIDEFLSGTYDPLADKDREIAELRERCERREATCSLKNRHIEKLEAENAELKRKVPYNDAPKDECDRRDAILADATTYKAQKERREETDGRRI